MLDLLVLALSLWLLAKGTRAIVTYEEREKNWRRADAKQREKIVREECAWRVIGRLVGAGVLVTGAFTVASAGLAGMWVLAALRVVKPIKTEMREACGYRSTGSDDEAPYW